MSEAYAHPEDLKRLSTPMTQLQWRLEALGWDAYWGLLRGMSPEKASDFAGDLLRRIGPLTSTHKTMTRNLRLAFPDWPLERVRQSALDTWQCFGRTVGEMPHLARLFADPNHDRIVYEDVEALETLHASHQPAVLISGHFSNWEALNYAICKFLPRCRITYRALNNPFIDQRVWQSRRDMGVNLLAAKGESARDLMQALSKGDAVGLMNDQKFNAGTATKLFGHIAMTANGPVRLALKFNAPLVPVIMRRTAPARFRFSVYPPIALDRSAPREAAVEDGVHKVSAFIEAQVREDPSQWFWMHRRWPKEAWDAVGVR
jgi:KDO2-lipid IV(A) lauroyltransferase